MRMSAAFSADSTERGTRHKSSPRCQTLKLWSPQPQQLIHDSEQTLTSRLALSTSCSTFGCARMYFSCLFCASSPGTPTEARRESVQRYALGDEAQLIALRVRNFIVADDDLRSLSHIPIMMLFDIFCFDAPRYYRVVTQRRQLV